MGRKSIDEDLESQQTLIISMVKDGFTDKEISKKLGISLSTWRRKKSQNTKIKEIIEEITDEKDRQVEEKLFKNCIGYHYYEEVATKVKEEVKEETENGEVIVLTKEHVVVSNVKKYKGPDLNAQKYWLNNKKKAVWKDDPHKVANDKELTKIKKKQAEQGEW